MVPLSRKAASARSETLIEAASTGPSAFGRKVLEKFGWSEGKGLGREEQGISERVKVSKRTENEGLGLGKNEASSKPAANGGDWWTQMFESAASQLPSSGSKQRRPSVQSTDDDGESAAVEDEELKNMTPEDRELFVRCGGRRLSRRAGRDMPGKRKRVALADQALLEERAKSLAEQQDAAQDSAEQDQARARRKEKKRAKKAKRDRPAPSA